jgi:hypothetical protein
MIIEKYRLLTNHFWHSNHFRPETGSELRRGWTDNNCRSSQHFRILAQPDPYKKKLHFSRHILQFANMYSFSFQTLVAVRLSLSLSLSLFSLSLTWRRPSRLRGMVTHLLGWPGQLSACSSDSMAPLVFFNFFTRASTAFSAHFSSSSPCFQPSRRFTAGLVKEKRELRLVMMMRRRTSSPLTSFSHFYEESLRLIVVSLPTPTPPPPSLFLSLSLSLRRELCGDGSS